MTRWSAITRARGRGSALVYGSRSTTAAQDNLNPVVYHERGRYSAALIRGQRAKRSEDARSRVALARQLRLSERERSSAPSSEACGPQPS
jgi:hypothetical protein